MMDVKPSSSNTLVKSDAFHPLFSSQDADVVLGANDNQTLFRVHSWTLKTTSGWFQSLFSMPQQQQSPVHAGSTMNINLDEDARTLESLLRMICGLPINPLISYDEVDPLLFAAEKYDMPGPISLIRILLMTPPLIDQPLRLYAAASRFEWDQERKYASTRSLVLNIHAPEHHGVLRKMSTGAALDLVRLHRERREAVWRRLNEGPFVVGNTVAVCPRCRRTIDHHTWRELRYRVVLEMDARPLGDTVVGVGLVEWPEAKACWEAKCPNNECKCVLYDKSETLRLITECIDNLPKST